MQSPSMPDNESYDNLLICQDDDIWSWWNYFDSLYYDTSIDSSINNTDIILNHDNNFGYYISSNSSSNSNNDYSSSAMTSPPLSITSSQDSPLVLSMDDQLHSSGYFSPLSIEKKPHKCTFCIRSFTRRHDLDRHTRIHTGVKPYSCPCCQKSFARSDARGRHFLADPICLKDSQVKKLVKTRRRHL